MPSHQKRTESRARVERRKTLWRLAFVVIPALVGLVVLEFAIRTRFPVNGAIYQADAELLHKHRPGSRKMYRHPPADGGQWVLVKINEEGRRGPVSASAQTPRVLVYGDSFIAAEYSAWENTFCARL